MSLCLISFYIDCPICFENKRILYQTYVFSHLNWKLLVLHPSLNGCPSFHFLHVKLHQPLSKFSPNVAQITSTLRKFKFVKIKGIIFLQRGRGNKERYSCYDFKHLTIQLSSRSTAYFFLQKHVQKVLQIFLIKIYSTKLSRYIVLISWKLKLLSLRWAMWLLSLLFA